MAKLPPEVTGTLAVCGRVRTLWLAVSHLRGEKQISQRLFCELADVKTNTFNQWIKDNGPPDLEHGMKLCDTLNITLDWLYRGSTGGMSVEISDAIRKVERAGKAEVGLEKPPPFVRPKSSRSR